MDTMLNEFYNSKAWRFYGHSQMFWKTKSLLGTKEPLDRKWCSAFEDSGSKVL